MTGMGAHPLLPAAMRPPLVQISLLFSLLISVLIISGCGQTPPPRTISRTPAALVQAHSALEAGNIERARSIFASWESPEKAASVRGMARIGLGRCALASGQIEAAIRHLDMARKLLGPGTQLARAHLYLGEALLRSGSTNSGLNQLEKAYPSLLDADNRRRAAYLITRTLDQLGEAVPALYRNAAGNASFPEYTSIWLRDVTPGPTVVETAPTVVPRVTVRNAPKRIQVHKRSSWQASPPRTRRVVPMTRPSRITVHHTADQPAIASLGIRDPEQYLRRIQDYCTGSLNWGDIGYHYLISADGRIWEGRSIQYQGAHAGNNSLNRGNIGIALIGNFDRDRPTSSQVESLGSLLGALASVHEIRPSRIYGHKDLRDTGCPGKHLQSILARLVDRLNRSGQARGTR
jgi:tetratricopeptide (TPR) repeat protein